MAAVRDGRQEVALIGMARRRRRALLLGTALQAAAVMVLALPAGAQPAPGARPLGGQVVAGSAVITRAPNTTTITQSSARAAVNWKSFDVGSQQTVRFAQPSVTASTLNRVTGPDPSQIAGRIQANGQVVLVNQSGVVFYKGAQVDVAGLVVSAAGITNRNFMAGRMKFDQPARPNARIENRGNITIRQAGLAALVAPQVANSGVISAKLGRVVLAGAVTHTLDMYGDGLLSIDVNGEVRQVPSGPNGKPATALVTNTGTVIAEGGRVLLTARAADGIVQNLVDAGGRIAAPTAGGRTGMVAIQGVGGSIVIAGQLDATGAAAGERGGRIAVNATDAVTLGARARLDASGRAGGGTVAIGTTLARAAGGNAVAPKRTARKVTVRKGATVVADATGRGDGGRVTVLSTDSTDMEGAISARGGPGGGNGGFVEVSGAAGFALTGGVDVSAPAGPRGKILLDPNDLDVVAEGEGGQVGTVGSANTLEATGSSAVVTAYTLAGLGETGDVELDASGTLGVHANVSVASGLSLHAGGAMTIDPNVSVAAGPFSTLGMTAGGDLLVGAGATLSAGTVNLQAAGMTVAGSVLAGSDASLLATRTVAVTGLVQAGPGGTLSVTAPALTLSGGGSLVVQALSGQGPLLAGTMQPAARGPVRSGTLVPGLIRLQADAMSLAGGHVLAEDGAVAIAPLTAGATLSLDGSTVAGHLSLTQADLDAIQTIGSLGAGNGPLGTQTLVLGSLDGVTASATTGRLEINAGVNLGGVASTLSLFSAGDIVEQGAGAVSVDALTGAAGGQIQLGGANALVRIGGLAGGSIALTNNGDLEVSGPIVANTRSVGIVVHAGGEELGALTNDSTVQAATTVSLSADDEIGNFGSIGAGTDLRLHAGYDIYNEGSLSAGANADLQATHDISNDMTLIAGGNATLAAGNDIDNWGTIHADADLMVGATHDINNFGLIDAGSDAHLQAGNDIANGAMITAGANGTLDAGHDIANLAAEMAEIADGQSLQGPLIQAGADMDLHATHDIRNDGTVTAGLNGSLVAGGTVGVTGLVQAGEGGTLDVAGSSVTLSGGGSLVVYAVEPDGPGTIVPGLIRLRADAMSLSGGSVIADDGAVAIAPLTTGGTLSLDAATVAGHLSLTQADLDAISTIGEGGGGGLGTQTLVLGSLDGATASPTTGRLEINTGISLDGIASTLALFSAGDVVEQGGGAVSVDALTGAAAGHILLGGGNDVVRIGDPGLTGGTIYLTDDRDLEVMAPVIATTGSVGITVHAGAETAGTLTNASTIQAATTVGLIADADIENDASVIAGTGATLVAGGNIVNPGTLNATGDAALDATNDVDNSGLIAAGNDVRVTATHDVANIGSITANHDAIVAAGNDIANYGAVPLTAGVTESPAVAIGNAGLIEASHDARLIATRDIIEDGTVLAGHDGMLTAGRTIAVTGLVQAGDGGTLAVTAPSLALSDGGSLIVHPIEPEEGGGVTLPGLIRLQADTMSLAGGQVIADDGAVAIAPLAAGGTLSLDDATASGHLSLTQADLDAIETIGRLGVGNGPRGTQTLVLGSLDGATPSPTNARLEIGAGLDLTTIASTLSLFSAGDAVEQGAGAVRVNALTGAARGHILMDGANQVARIGAPATVGAYSTPGSFAGGLSAGTIDLADNRDLTVVAPVIATSGSVGIAVHAGAETAGTLTNASTIQAPSTVRLSADADIDNAGVVVAGIDAGLSAGHDVNNAGEARAGNDVDLAAGNSIANRGLIDAGNDAQLAAPAIDNAAIVTAGRDIALAAGQGIASSGTLIAGRNAAVAAGSDIVQTGGTILAGAATLTAGGGITQTAGLIAAQPSGASSVELAAGSNITLGGALTAGRIALSTPGDIDATGVLTTGLLSGNAGVAPSAAQPNGVLGSANLTGANRIAALGAFVTTGSLVLDNAADLTIAGPVTTGAIAAGNPQVGANRFGATINVPDGTITVAGKLTAGIAAPGATAGLVLPGGDIVLNAGAIAIPGEVVAADGVNGGGTLATVGGSSITETGTIVAALLTGSTGGFADFAGAGNAVQVLGPFIAGDFALTDGQDLRVSGPVTATGGSVALAAHAGHGTQAILATSGFIGAGSDIDLDADAAVVQTAGTIAAHGTVSLTAATGGIALAGVVSGAEMHVSTPGDIVQTGTLVTANLTGNAGVAPGAGSPGGTLGSASFLGANRIAALGSFVATGSLVVNDGQALAIAGPVFTNGAAIAAPAIAVTGQLAAPGGDIALTATGSIELGGILAAAAGASGGGSVVLNAGAGVHQSGGAIMAAALRGNVGGSVVLNAGANRIGSIGDFTVSPPTTGVFRLTATGNLLLAGTLTSHLIVIDDRTGQITLGGGASIATGGIARPAGASPMPVEADGGAYLTDFAQIGRSSVTGIGGGPAILGITALGQGNITFDSRTPTSGLYGPNTWLVLTLGDAAAPGPLGAASGNVFVKSLDVRFYGTGGHADLGGTIGTLTGQVAAGAAGITPRVDSNYRFNACPIHSVHCVLLPVEGLPPRSPLQDFSIGTVSDQGGEDDLLLPIVSDRDYSLTDGKGEQDLQMPIVSDRDY